MSSQAQDHLHRVLSREYWRCLGLAENGRSEAAAHRGLVEKFDTEHSKWQARADEVLRQLDGEVPENVLPTEVDL